MKKRPQFLRLMSKEASLVVRAIKSPPLLPLMLIGASAIVMLSVTLANLAFNSIVGR